MCCTLYVLFFSNFYIKFEIKLFIFIFFKKCTEFFWIPARIHMLCLAFSRSSREISGMFYCVWECVHYKSTWINVALNFRLLWLANDSDMILNSDSANLNHKPLNPKPAPLSKVISCWSKNKTKLDNDWESRFGIWSSNVIEWHCFSGEVIIESCLGTAHRIQIEPWSKEEIKLTSAQLNDTDRWTHSFQPHTKYTPIQLILAKIVNKNGCYEWDKENCTHKETQTIHNSTMTKTTPKKK